MRIVRALLLVTPLLVASSQNLVRAEFQVNVSTEGDQAGPAVAMAPDGSFVVAWWSNFPVGGGGVFTTQILMRRYGADGTPLGSETVVPMTGANTIISPLVAMAADGSFVLVANGDAGVRFQRFDAAGAPVGTDTFVGFGQAASLAVASDGRFVVVRSLAFPGEIRATVFDASGGTLVPEFVVAPVAEASWPHTVGIADDGSFVVAWRGLDAHEAGVLARRFDATGTPLGTEFVVNDITTDFQQDPRIAMASSGTFVVVWESATITGGTARVRRFDATGAALGSGVEVDVRALSPSIARFPDGSFVVAFTAEDGDQEGTFARRFDVGGVPQGPSIQVSAFETGAADRPEVAAGPDGRSVVTWTNAVPGGTGSDDWNVLAQRLLEGFVDEPIDALKLVLVRRGTREKLIFVSKDSDAGFPPLGSLDDPATGSPGGALLELFSPTEGAVQIQAPAGAGLPGWSMRHNLNTDLAKFVNREAPGGLGAVKRMTLKARKVTKAQAALIGLPLAAPQTAVAVRLTMGTRRSCALFDAPTIKTNVADKFVAGGAISTGLPDCSDATMAGIP